MINSALTSKNFVTAINMLIDNKLNDARFATAAIVTKVNDNTTINAQPIVEERRRLYNNQYKYEKLPELVNIPYLLLHTPSPGELCVLIHLDRGINTQSFDLETSTESVKYIKNKSKAHDLSNCVAIVGFKNISQDINNPASTISTSAAMYYETNSGGEEAPTNKLISEEFERLKQKINELEQQVQQLQQLQNK